MDEIADLVLLTLKCGPARDDARSSRPGLEPRFWAVFCYLDVVDRGRVSLRTNLHDGGHDRSGKSADEQ